MKLPEQVQHSTAMKRIFACVLLLTVMLLNASASAEIDLSDLSFDELIALQSKLTEEFLSRSEWKEIKVPVGTYEVGVDIPAGVYTVTIKQSSTNFWVRDGINGYTLQNLALYSQYEDRSIIKKLILEDGNIVEINSSAVYFLPYTGLGF